MAAQAAPPSGSVSPAPPAPLTRASLSCHLSRGASREFHRGEFGCFPAPHPGPGTQEVLSEHEQWGQVSTPPPCSLALASVTLELQFPFLWNQELQPLSPGFCLSRARVAPVSQIQSLCVLPPPGLRLTLSQMGAAHPLGHPGLRGSRPWPTLEGGVSFRRSLCLFPPCAL